MLRSVSTRHCSLVLELAIKAEWVEKTFYEEAREESGTSLGKSLFTRLAKEEDFHAAKAREIGEFLQRGENPLAIEESLDRGKKLGNILKAANQEKMLNQEVITSELEIIKRALDNEEKSYKFYEDQCDSVKNEFERRFFKAILEVERMHSDILIRYKKLLLNGK